MSKTLIVIIVLIVVAVVGYFVYPLVTMPEKIEGTEENGEPEGVMSAEQSCVDSGGQVTTALCCETTEDFPNLCLVGPCGCAPENSHDVAVCDCGPELCFDGTECVAVETETETETE